MSISSHSPAPSVVGNGNLSAEGENPPMTSANHSPAPSVIGGSSLYPDLSTSIRTPPQYSYSDVIPQRCLIQNHNYNGGSNGAFRNVSSLGLPNGPRPYYSEEHGWGICRRQGGYGYQDWCNEMMMTTSYQGLRGMGPQMQQPPEQLRPFSVPLTPPPTCPVPSFWPTFQGPIALSHVPFDVYRRPAHPEARYFRGPSYVVPRPELEAAQPQHSDFSSSLDDLRARLRKQIEYYFSSENLRTDYYLKKLMDGHGWVSVTLIMKFRKVVALLKEKDIKLQSASISDVLQVQDRSLSNDQQFVLDSLRPSDAVEVQGDKMRKQHEWEKWVLIPP